MESQGWCILGRAYRTIAVLISLAGLLALPAAVHAASHTLDFDSSPAGTPVASGPGGLAFVGGPVTFAAGANAASPPNILRRSGTCPNAGSQCTTGDHGQAGRGTARNLSVRLGVQLSGAARGIRR
jgi:hypothetical protein